MVLLHDPENPSFIGKISDIGALFTTLKDRIGNSLFRRHRENLESSFEGIMIVGKNDDTAMAIRTDRKGNLMIGNYIPELADAFEGATVNVQKWTPLNSTFVPAQSTIGGYNFNNSNLTTINAYAILQSQRLFYKLPRVPLQAKIRIRANINTNSNADFGFGVPATTTMLVPTGVAVRIVNGLWYGVLTFSNAELGTLQALVMADGVTQFSTANSNAEFYVVDIVVDDDNVLITVQNTQTGVIVATADIPVPLSSLAMWSATALPFYARVWNASAAPSIAPIFTMGYVQVLSTDRSLQPDSSQIAGNLGLTAGRNPFTGVQTENHTNSVAPVSATLANATAGYVTLGGRYQFAAVAGAITDYALFAFTVPAGSKFLCEGIRIETYNIGAISATTPTVLEWAMGFNSSAVSLATANIIRRQVGVQSIPVGTAIGGNVAPIDVKFETPEVVESGRFLHVILNVPVGTTTASQIIRGQVMIKGRYI